MSQILSQSALLLALWCCCALLVASRSYNNGLIFYDVQSQQPYLPPTVSVSRGRILANVKFSEKGSIWSTFGQPCECKGNLCGCCAGIKVKQYKFDQKMCANITFVPKKEEAQLDVYLNGKPSSKYGISARNPSPFCIPVMMSIPMAMCVQLSDIAIKGNNLNMCMDFVVRLATTDLFEMHFQCMKMGLDGFQYLDKNGKPVIPLNSSKKEETTTQKVADDDEEYYEEEDETTTAATVAESENEIAGNMPNTESENALPSESATDKINEATVQQQQQQQLLQEQMQQLQQQLQQTIQQQQAMQSEQQKLEIEHESEMSTTDSASDIDEFATAATIAAATTTVATEPQQNEIIDVITMAPATATAQAPAAATNAAPSATTMSLESLEQFSDVATDTIAVAATTAAAAANAETTTKAAAATEATHVDDASSNSNNNSNNKHSGDNIDGDGDDGDDDENEDADESEADNEVDADAAEEEYEEDKSAAADNYAGDATASESGSVNNDSVADVENMETDVDTAADADANANVDANVDANAIALATTEAANAAAVQQLPAAVSSDENDLEAMASVTDANVASVEQAETTEKERQGEVERVREALLSAVQAQMATARKMPRARLMARYRYLHG